MKESRLIEMSNKIDTLGAVAQRLMAESENLKTLAIGTMELVKNLPGYEEALEKLKEANEQSERDTE